MTETEAEIIQEGVVARELAFKCPEYRRLEKIYLDGVELEYTKSDETIEALEEEGVDTSQYLTEESRKRSDEHEESAYKAREDHVDTCTSEGCVLLRITKEKLEKLKQNKGGN